MKQSRKRFVVNLLAMSEAQLHDQVRVLESLGTDRSLSGPELECRGAVLRATIGVAELLYPGFEARHVLTRPAPAGWTTVRA